MKPWSPVTTANLVIVAIFLNCFGKPETAHQAPVQNLPEASVAACRPTFATVSDETMEVWSGFWKLGVDAFLIGCEADLKQLTPHERELLAVRIKSETEEAGFSVEHRIRENRSQLVKDLNGTLGRPVLTDILLILRFSIEHEPIPDRPDQ